MEPSLCPDAVRSALEDTAGWDLLDENGVARLAHHALFFAGRGHTPIDPLLGAFFPEYAKRVPAERRSEVFTRVRSLVHEGVLCGAVLPYFLCHETDPALVSTAARDVAALNLVEAASGARGADLVLKLVITGAVANPGAALGVAIKAPAQERPRDAPALVIRVRADGLELAEVLVHTGIRELLIGL